MKLLVNNVAGLNQPHKLHRALQLARQHDITMFQEVKLKRNQATHVRSKWGSPDIFLSCAATSRRGVLTLIHPRANPIYLHEVADRDGQFHILVVKIRGETYLLANVYGVPDSDIEAERSLRTMLHHLEHISTSYPIQHTILGGDWNFVLRDVDTTSTSRKPRAEAVCRTILDTLDLYDVAALQATHPGFTYFRHQAETTRARYDRIYVSPTILSGVSIRLLPRTSDHTPVQMISTCNNSPKSWRFPDQLLHDAEFLTGLHETLRRTLSLFSDQTDVPLKDIQKCIDYDSHSSPRILTRIIKSVRGYCMNQDKIRSQQRKEREKVLIQDLVRTREAFNSSPNPDEATVAAFEEAKRMLIGAQTSRALAAASLNHTQYSAFGERTSRYFFQRSGRGLPSREIPKLIVQSPDGAQVLQGPDIPQHMFDKYSEIVQEDPIAGSLSIEEFLGPELTMSLRKCPNEHFVWLESPVLHKEVRDIIKELKPISAPGPLGISNNLLKEMAPFMEEILVRFGNDLLFSEEIPPIDPFFYHRLVIFILKPGKDPLDPDSYRGLSLLENVFKLYSKLLANRMMRPLTHIQSLHQFGFTRSRGCLEASRCVIDTIRHARRKGKPLIVISTDFKKAFDSISLDHVEKCLRIYQFPQKYITAIMRLVRNGTMQFQVNASTSQDFELRSGSGQGDPKSSGIFNLSSEPLNHYLSESPEVPRYEVDDTDISPVSYADDNMLLLQGDQIARILLTILKIQEYRRVSGLQLNPPKCEIMAINCEEVDVQRIINETQMRRVSAIKHLGLVINDQGDLAHDSNIAPIEGAMNRIADSLTTLSSSPLGRAIFAKFLLSSRYLHKIQNYEFSHEQLVHLREAVLKLTWSRHRMGTDTTTSRVHIAHNRVAQPLSYGGLAVPDPLIQAKALRLIWARKFRHPNQRLTWVRILEEQLRECRRPPLAKHGALGYHEWKATAEAIDSTFWSQVFHTMAELIALSHEFDRYWHIIPITGYELNDFGTVDISSLAYVNPPVKRMIDAGLVNIGQLFNESAVGTIDRGSLKTFDQLEQEFSTDIPPLVRNSISALAVQVRRRYQASSSYVLSPLTTILSLLSVKSSGCQEASRLLLKQQRRDWTWGDFPRSYFTYTLEQRIGISSQQFSASFRRTRSSTLPPSFQWTSMQILLRTLWTNVKESNTIRNLTSSSPISNWCSICHLQPEHTSHLIFDCHVAQGAWMVTQDKFNQCVARTRNDYVPIEIGYDQAMFNHPPDGLNDQEKRDLVDILMVTKHVLYRLKFRENMNRVPSTRLVTTIMCIELEKASTVRDFLGKASLTFTRFIEMLKEQVGF